LAVALSELSPVASPPDPRSFDAAPAAPVVADALPRIPAGSPWSGPYSAAAAALAGLPPVPVTLPRVAAGPDEVLSSPDPAPVAPPPGPAWPVVSYPLPTTAWGLDQATASGGFHPTGFRPAPAPTDDLFPVGVPLDVAEPSGLLAATTVVSDDGAQPEASAPQTVATPSSSRAAPNPSKSHVSGELARSLGALQATAQAVSLLSGPGVAATPRKAYDQPVETPRPDSLIGAPAPVDTVAPEGSVPRAVAPSSVVYPFPFAPAAGQTTAGAESLAVFGAAPDGNDPVPEGSPFPGVATVLGVRRPG